MKNNNILLALAIIGIGVSCEKPSTNTSTATTKRTYYIDYDVDGTKVRYEDTSLLPSMSYSQKDDNVFTNGKTLPWETASGAVIYGTTPFGPNSFGFPKIYMQFNLGNFSKIKLNEKIYNDTLTSYNLGQVNVNNFFSFYKKSSPKLPTAIGINTVDTSALNYEGGNLNGFTSNRKYGDWKPSFKNSYIVLNKIEEIKYGNFKCKVITGEIRGVLRKYKQGPSIYPDRLQNSFLGSTNATVKFSLPCLIY